MNRPILLFIIAFSLFSCKDKNASTSKEITTNDSESNISEDTVTSSFKNIEELKWLIGNWKGLETDRETQENWTQRDKSSFVLDGFTIVKNDTVFHEKIILEETLQGTYMIVENLLDAKEPKVLFRLSSFENGVAVFSNPDHDFPQNIRYMKPVNDTLRASIDGIIDTKLQTIDFTFVK